MYPITMSRRYDSTNLVALQNLYTTVYLGNYISGDFSEGHGSHPGVDMIPATHAQPVYAILDGTVVFAGTNGMDGNYVVLQHPGAPDPDNPSVTTTLYSGYLHLSSFCVATGQVIKEGTVIGVTGNTGNSTAEHLHFQIDRISAPFHAYWPFTNQDASAQGLGFFEAVNVGLGLANAQKYCINPLMYLTKIGRDAMPSGGGSSPQPQPPAALVTPMSTPAPAPTQAPDPAPTDSVADILSRATASTPTPTPIPTPTPVPTPVPVAVAPTLATTPATPFVDVSTDYPYISSIQYLKDQGIVTGSNGFFLPNNNISRVELLKMIIGAAKIPLSTSTTQYFSDIDPTAWYVPYVNTAKERGIVGGYDDGTFRPNNPVTRAEGFKIVINTMGKQVTDTPVPLFNDVTPLDWFTPYADYAKQNNLIQFSGISFLPNQLITRGEVASAIATIMQS